MRDANELYDYYTIVRPSSATREAGFSNTTYLNIIDDSEMWSEYPDRRKSIICSTSDDISKSFGRLYVVIPTDNAKFGVCPDYDFQQCFDKFDIKFEVINGIQNGK